MAESQEEDTLAYTEDFPQKKLPVVLDLRFKNNENTLQDDSIFYIDFKKYYSRENSDHFFEAIVQIRDQMEKEFGINGQNDILLNYTKNMLKKRIEAEIKEAEPE